MKKLLILLTVLLLFLLNACQEEAEPPKGAGGEATVASVSTVLPNESDAPFVSEVTTGSLSSLTAAAATTTEVPLATEKPLTSRPPSTTAVPTASVPKDDPRREVVICLDAGHGLIDPGAVGKLSGVTYYEKTINLSLALKIEARLASRGYQVVMIRRGDTSLLGGSSMSAKYSTVNEAVARRRLGKKAGADLYLSIHCNSYGGEGRASGPIVFYQSSQKTTYKALSLANLFSSGITAVNRQTETGRDCRVRAGDSYIVLKELSMPSLLLEVGFMSDEEDLALISSEGWQDAFADGILESVEEAFSKGYIG